MDIACSHPGEHLAYELEALHMGAAELALHVNVPSSRIRKLIEGREPITGEMALRLGHFFGTSAGFWMNLQAVYELRVADHASNDTKPSDAEGGSAQGKSALANRTGTKTRDDTTAGEGKPKIPHEGYIATASSAFRVPSLTINVVGRY